MTQVPGGHRGPAAITLRGVCVRLGGQSILSDVSAEIPAGELTALIGPNGAGKTTLLRVLLNQVPYVGRVEFRGASNARPRIGYVPQTLDFDRGAPIRVVDFLACGSQRRALWLGIARSVRRAAIAALEQIGAAGLIDRRLGQLSGGELQRVLLAMALLREPEILLLDEPVAGVDLAGRGMFCDVVGTLQRRLRCTVVLVSHDLSVVTEHASYVICMNRTIHCQGRTVDTLTAENLRTIYGPTAALHHHVHAHEGARHSHPTHAHPDHHGHEHAGP
ncbi:MAG: metal ABC transporter ATP-binding protein [Phycisphaerae bacterium]|nr:metal ABC transporter ATP-binding protein [Phycisphaerae bacterium]